MTVPSPALPGLYSNHAPGSFTMPVSPSWLTLTFTSLVPSRRSASTSSSPRLARIESPTSSSAAVSPRARSGTTVSLLESSKRFSFVVLTANASVAVVPSTDAVPAACPAWRASSGHGASAAMTRMSTVRPAGVIFNLPPRIRETGRSIAEKAGAPRSSDPGHPVGGRLVSLGTGTGERSQRPAGCGRGA